MKEHPEGIWRKRTHGLRSLCQKLKDGLESFAEKPREDIQKLPDGLEELGVEKKRPKYKLEVRENMSRWDDHKCDNCGKDLGYDSYNTAQVRMCGEFHATLCNACRNAWFRFVTGKDEYIGLGKVESRYKAIDICYRGVGESLVDVAEQQIWELNQRKHNLLKDLHQIAENWLKASEKVCVED